MDAEQKLMAALAGMVEVFHFEIGHLTDGCYPITVEHPIQGFTGTQRHTFTLSQDEIDTRSVEALRVLIRDELPDLPLDTTGQAAWEYAVSQIEHIERERGGENYHNKACYAISPAAVLYARKQMAKLGVAPQADGLTDAPS